MLILVLFNTRFTAIILLMSLGIEALFQTQQLALDVMSVQRNHQIPGDTRQENVVEHSYGVALLAWQLHGAYAPELSLPTVLQYCLVHDSPERGLERDTNTYASPEERLQKDRREKEQVRLMGAEFGGDFPDLVDAINRYQAQVDEEGIFVYTVDKMQAIIMAMMDDWRAYRTAVPGGITFEDFQKKNRELLGRSSRFLTDIFVDLVTHAEADYFANPNKV